MSLRPDSASHEGRSPGDRFVCFLLGDQELALPIHAVRETIRLRPITRVFLTPSWLVGIFGLRGEIVPAIDLAPWLGMSRTSVGPESRLIVLRQRSKVLAILADALAELRVMDGATLSSAPRTLSAEQSALVTAVASTPTGTVRVLDPDALFASDRLRELETHAA